MKRSLLLLLLTASACVYLPGCCSSVKVTKTQSMTPLDESSTVSNKPEKSAVSPIRGAWSEPVNGLRMSVKQISANTASDHLTLLILVENVSDQSVHWPGIRPMTRVFQSHSQQERHADRQVQRSHPDKNLLITIDPVRGPWQSDSSFYQQLSERMQEIHVPIAPGEIRLHAIEITPPKQRLALMQMQREWTTIQADTVIWPLMNDLKNARRYRVSLTYRPDGMFPGIEDGEQVEKLETEDWKGKQIDIPPIEIIWYPKNADGSQEINEF